MASKREFGAWEKAATRTCTIQWSAAQEAAKWRAEGEAWRPGRGAGRGVYKTGSIPCGSPVPKMPPRRAPLLLLAVLLLASAASAGRHPLSAPGRPHEVQLVQSWAEAARKWFFTAFSAAEGKEAEEVAAAFGLFNVDMARAVARMPRNEVRIYAAVADEGDALNATLPDGRMSRSGAHHGVLLLDPFPAARFGHPVLLFFVDRAVGEKRCHTIGGKRLGE